MDLSIYTATFVTTYANTILIIIDSFTLHLLPFYYSSNITLMSDYSPASTILDFGGHFQFSET